MPALRTAPRGRARLGQNYNPRGVGRRLRPPCGPVALTASRFRVRPRQVRRRPQAAARSEEPLFGVWGSGARATCGRSASTPTIIHWAGDQLDGLRRARSGRIRACTRVSGNASRRRVERRRLGGRFVALGRHGVVDRAERHDASISRGVWADGADDVWGRSAGTPPGSHSGHYPALRWNQVVAELPHSDSTLARARVEHGARRRVGPSATTWWWLHWGRRDSRGAPGSAAASITRTLVSDAMATRLPGWKIRDGRRAA